MKRTSVGTRLYVSVLAVFAVFAIAFIVFQHTREREYKIETLDVRLQDYNTALAETLLGDTTGLVQLTSRYVVTHPLKGLRVTVIDVQGRVLYDNMYQDYARMGSHLGRKEVKAAIVNGHGYDINRLSTTLKHTYFYSATYFPDKKIVVRSALPYDNDLARMLRADQHYLWFSLVTVVILVLILYQFVSRLSDNITKLRLFASRADHNESLDTEDLAEFPADELGEIAERIIKLYKRLQKTKEEQNILKRQLTQNIAHELKTPVASIQGYLETILENPHIDNATKEQFLQRCYAQSGRLTSLLSDISTLNRMDDAPVMHSFERVDINQLIVNIIKETSLQMQGRRMKFSDLMPYGVVVNGNQSLLYSVFRNLTDNAIAYAGEGTTITLTAEDKGDKWQFFFSDNGVGVPIEHLPRLFERFYRVDKGRSRKMGGTGLGLAIVKNAILLHGGTISVRNNVTGGLRFEFTLRKTPVNKKQP